MFEIVNLTFAPAFEKVVLAVLVLAVIFGILAPKLFSEKGKKYRKISDLVSVAAVFLILWKWLTVVDWQSLPWINGKEWNREKDGFLKYLILMKWYKPFLIPPPEDIWSLILNNRSLLLSHVKTSLSLIFHGYILGVLVAVPLGLFIGISNRAGTTLTIISKFLASIPPIVYIPYGIAMLPTFEGSRLLVIFLATFWPVLSATVSGVLYTEKRYVEAAQIYGYKKNAILFKVVLPNALPQIFTGLNQGLSVSFILLTSAEMIATRGGLGSYISIASDNGDWKSTLAGVILIGIVVSLVFFLFSLLQKHLLRWKT